MKNKVLLAILVLMAAFLMGKEDLAMAKIREIQLPQPRLKGKVSLEEAIAKRRSQRSFAKNSLSLEEIGQLLWAAQGITATGRGFGFRTAPSAGALYPLEVYLASKDGLFHYLPEGHRLEVLAETDLRNQLHRAALGQGSVAQAAIDIIICAVYTRVTGQYGERGIRYTDIEVGHAAQNIHLEAAALGFGSVPVGAFNDQRVKEILLLPADCQPLYIIPVGYPD
jgi:SagB-type dehydrogenase family enzyme